MRGLKYPALVDLGGFAVVAPFTGAWIEIRRGKEVFMVNDEVAPFTGAWIEIPAGVEYR